ncbi:MAG: twin-arginine translocase TatA/TatE family subunit [Vicinamibacterales bacterium]|jgi:sec-independent protein translocase protein TatA|nr:twin-arginine translocase TatA/TatE family subunit [Acidobacteriota bacterium]MDP6372071.1 twin-arginine translocase TatA/TatE family subunit [Vicinamibacterales bacterium]MDP6608045.1 twin-arginine translocase TatA/TatE family subunit [Vicinamibacterales bacterium]HAK54720.1 twin-arginine translocase TatA/TatE family subunit [Acidobacteriota bacterium]|tara:strand:+ start:2561 stop:2725 length:165 start_codon:yes stop_codon:yes gene_type:complete
MPFGIGLMELVVIFFILLLIFGANRLSGIGKGMGKAIRGFKDEVKDPNAPNEDA